MAKTPKDPFHENAPQVPAWQPPPEPPDLRSTDDPMNGRLNPKPIEITDPGHRSRFSPEAEPVRDYIKGRK